MSSKRYMFTLTVLSLYCILIVTSSPVFKFEQKQSRSNDWLHKLETLGKSKPDSFDLENSETQEDLNVQYADSSTRASTDTCGYKACDLGKPDMLNVHMVPHTHDDVGWLKTVDQYFYGARNDIQHAGVQYILDSVVDELSKDPVKRFIYVEIAFFARWWNEQHDSMRHLVKRLTNEGRLEFILGGWCMNDEASTHYNAIIDQHTLGFQFLKRNLGECATPKIGWQIDPFGHSREQASLFAQFGFDGLFFGRLDYQDKRHREDTHTMELMWKGSKNLGNQGYLFTGVNYNGYDAPGGFCFDQGCDDVPVQDDPRLEDFNVDERVKLYIQAALNQSLNYTTNHIMFTMGSDFEYENAHVNYKNMDKIIRYVNDKQASGSRVNVMYSTPSCYLYALNQANQTYTTKSDDFFPYASEPHVFWTGYFTSRPSLKGYVRTTNNFLQVCKQMDVLADLESTYGSDLKIDILRQAMGVAQHHDAVSGTAKQHVTDDYSKRLARGNKECQEVVNYAFNKLLPLNPGTAQVEQEFCNLLNVSSCPTTEHNDKFTVTLYNPIGRPVTHFVHIPVTGTKYTVIGPDGNLVPNTVAPISAETKNIPAHQGSVATGDLVFSTSLPSLGFATYFVENVPMHEWETLKYSQPHISKENIVIKNEKVLLSFDGATGLLSGMSNLITGLSLPVKQSLLYYQAFQGNNSKPDLHASGAYVFRPNSSSPIPINSGSPTIRLVQQDGFQEVHQVFSDWASQVIRLYPGQDYAEFEWTVGPIPISDGQGKEVISRFTSNLKSAGTFYTDSNGREIIKRVRDYRPTWKLNQTESVAGNYYPVNSRAYIQDTDADIQLTILNDRTQGGASIQDGELELMVHRRLLVDDALGVGEPLNETGISGKGLVVRGKHYVFLEKISDSARLHRDKAEKLYMAPSISFASLTETPQEYRAKYRTVWSGLKSALPDNVHLLTLEQWEGATLLLRLEHFYEEGEDSTLSKPATVDLKGLFTTFNVASVKEMTLGANTPLKDAKRLEWNVKDEGRMNGDMSSYVTPVDPTDLKVILNPMQIRTFQVTLKQQ